MSKKARYQWKCKQRLNSHLSKILLETSATYYATTDYDYSIVVGNYEVRGKE